VKLVNVNAAFHLLLKRGNGHWSDLENAGKNVLNHLIKETTGKPTTSVIKQPSKQVRLNDSEKPENKHLKENIGIGIESSNNYCISRGGQRFRVR
jgi:hypothetical protein